MQEWAEGVIGVASILMTMFSDIASNIQRLPKVAAFIIAPILKLYFSW